MAKQNADVEYLKEHSLELRSLYEGARHADIVPIGLAEPGLVNDADERVARLADDHDFDGNLFRHLDAPGENRNESLTMAVRKLRRQIETLPKIIAKIEAAEGEHTVPDKAALLTVRDLAVVLRMGESTVRQQDRQGLIPAPKRIGGSLLWSRQEIAAWIDADCPPRQKWALLPRKGA